MPDADKSAALFRHARREAIMTLIVWAFAVTWTVGCCYLFGYEHQPDYTHVADVDRPNAGEPGYRNPLEGWLVRSGLAARRTPENFRFVFGLPDWVFFGIVLPWVAATAFTMLYSSHGMTDDDLGAEAKGGAGDGH